MAKASWVNHTTAHARRRIDARVDRHQRPMRRWLRWLRVAQASITSTLFDTVAPARTALPARKARCAPLAPRRERPFGTDVFHLECRARAWTCTAFEHISKCLSTGLAWTPRPPPRSSLNQPFGTPVLPFGRSASACVPARHPDRTVADAFSVMSDSIDSVTSSVQEMSATLAEVAKDWAQGCEIATTANDAVMRTTEMTTALQTAS